MKKITLLLMLIFSINIIYANKLYYTDDAIKDSFAINEIQFSISGNPGWDISYDLLKKNLFSLTIKQDGTALLKWNGRCPQSRNNTLICSYAGSMSKKDFKKLSKKLNEINFTRFKDEYREDIDDRGANEYIITYNGNFQKKIIDENYNIDGLKEFREMLVKVKKGIKWVAIK
jgi:hypothetical protein